MANKESRSDSAPSEWHLKVAGGKEIATIVPVKLKRVEGELLKLPDAMLGTFSTLIGALPAAAGGAAVLGNQALLCTFTSEALEGVRNGSSEFLPTYKGLQATVRGVDDKRFTENATLLDPTAVKAVVIVALVWQAMAVVTAQQYLASIDARLQAIERDVAAIRFHLEAKVKAKLTADLQILLACYRTLNEDTPSREQRIELFSQVRDVDRDALGIFHLSRDKLVAAHANLNNWDPAADTLLGQSMNQRKQVGLEVLRNAKEAVRMALAALQVTSSCLILATHLPAEITWVDQRWKDAEANRLHLRKLCRELQVAVEAKLPTLKSFWWFHDDPAARAEVGKIVEETLEMMNAALAPMDQVGATIGEFISAKRDLHFIPKSLLLRTDRKGLVVEVQRVECN